MCRTCSRGHLETCLFTCIRTIFLPIPSSDLAYYDGVGETIVCVGFARPRPGIFSSRDVHHLLCLATPVELVVLGVSLQQPQALQSHRVLEDGQEGQPELHLLPTPLFRMSTGIQDELASFV